MMEYDTEMQEEEELEDSKPAGRPEKGKNNILPVWGNDKTMNLNNLILTNIQSSHYFKINLYELKTYHEVIDEIYYNVKHLEPWEKGSRKTSGQTGMCGGVRGVGAGGIVSTAFCLLYKLFTLKLTRKQVNGLLVHPDSPYIRALGFMYLRYTQPPQDLWEWFYPYLDDEEEVDCKAGGGCVMRIGEIIRNFMSKLEWFSTLFPRIPVPIQKDFEKKLAANPPKRPRVLADNKPQVEVAETNNAGRPPVDRRDAHKDDQSKNRDRGKQHENGRDLADDIAKERVRQTSRNNSRSRDRPDEKRDRRDRTDDRPRDRDRHGNRRRSRSRERKRSRSPQRIRHRSRDRQDDVSRSKDRPRDDRREHRHHHDHHHSDRGSRR